MKKLFVIAILGLATTASSAQCGLRPTELKPLPPLGCKDMVQVCTCDKSGQNCHWVWACVPQEHAQAAAWSRNADSRLTPADLPAHKERVRKWIEDYPAKPQ
jgi:hypothetical protein